MAKQESPLDSATKALESARAVASQAAATLADRVAARLAAEAALRQARASGDTKPALLELVDAQQLEADAQTALADADKAVTSAESALAATEHANALVRLEDLRQQSSAGARDQLVARLAAQEVDLRKQIMAIRIQAAEHAQQACQLAHEGSALARDLGEHFPDATPRWQAIQNAINRAVSDGLRVGLARNNPLTEGALHEADAR